MEEIKNVPTNIITGSLGVGKTTLIQSLLRNKPESERWAVLVNEFGEVGIDGALMAGTSSSNQESGVFIKEVPGGCMCCTSGLPMQIALNLLLAQARPDRLLIEPTGLGHPREVLETLMQPHYKDVLNIQATLTLLDLRKLENDKWRAHSTFREQVQIADVIVVTKSDLYSENLTSDLQDYLKELKINNTPVVTANKGELDISHLANTCKFNQVEENHHHHHHHGYDNKTTLLSAPETGALKVVNQGEGYFSRGWLCSKDMFFDFNKCQALFDGIEVERLKAVINTDKGAFGFNIVDGQLYVSPVDEAEDSRIELITSDSEYADVMAVEIEQKLNLV